MATLPSSGELDFKMIYDIATFWGYTGGYNIKDLSQWAGWTTANPNSSAPYSLSEFYSAATRLDLQMAVAHHNFNTSHDARVDAIEIWSGNFIWSVKSNTTDRTIPKGTAQVYNNELSRDSLRDVNPNAPYSSNAITIRVTKKSTSTPVPTAISLFYNNVQQGSFGTIQNSGNYYWALSTSQFLHSPMPPAGQEGATSKIRIDWN